MKKCNGPCEQVKEDSKFYIKRYKTGAVGLRALCIKCSILERDAWRFKNKAHDDARNNAYNKANARRIRGWKLQQNYWPHLTWEQALDIHDSLMLAQNSLCAICQKPGHPTRGLHVDHCHDTRVVRGLLCYNCNNALGRFQDDSRLLLEAVAYLGRFKKSA